MDLKRKLGFGALAGEEENQLASYLAEGVQNKKLSRFDTMMSKLVNNTVRELVVPWLLQCLQKYSEQEFHRRLDANYCVPHDMIHTDRDKNVCYHFDFIDDIITNHGSWYPNFLKTARRLRYRDWFQFDEKDTFNRIETVLTKQGWHLLHHERVVIWNDILRMKRDIYA